jgi:hypothetical protein
MEATLGISLYSYFYPKLAKMLCLFYFSYVFSSTKLAEQKRAEQVLPGSQGGWRVRGQGGEVAQTMYTHINKCIN